MSYAALYKGTVPIIQLALGDGGNDNLVWTRPAWPPLADLTSANNTFTAIYGVENSDSNFVSLLVATSAGTYTVDWGDGTTPDSGIASNVQANHTYDYATIAASAVGDFKPVVVTVTAQGGNITTFSFQVKHPLNIPNNSSMNWLDIAINASAMTSLSIGGWQFSGAVIRMTKLQKAVIYNSSITNASFLFGECYSLQSVSLLNSASLTSTSNMFYQCYSLQTVSLFNTSNVTDMLAMFQSCHALKSVPLFNTLSATSMSTMFNQCFSLQSVPLFNTVNVANMNGMFTQCYSLKSVPLFNTSSVTNMSLMFTQCHNLQTVPLFPTSTVTNMTNMFSNCFSLQSVPLFVTTAVTNMQTMFSNCHSLQSVPLFVTTAVTTMLGTFTNCYSLKNSPSFNTASVNMMATLFNNCYSLQSVSPLNTSSVTNMNVMFNNCQSLQAIPELNTALVTTASSMFDGCRSLCSGRTSGIRVSINYSNCKLSTNALNNIFSGLGTASGAQTITITGNPGEATCTKTIATNKGWTVVPA